MIQMVPIGKKWVASDLPATIETDSEDVIVILRDGRSVKAEIGTVAAATAAATKFASDVNASLAP